MMDLFDLSSRLFGSTRAEVNGTISNAVDVVSATGAADSSDGETSVYLDADVTPADDSTGDDAAIGVPTSPAVSAGDEVLIGLTGSGPLKVPVVLSNPGSGDRQQTQISTASTLATQAAAVANATGQHFWDDSDGAHVTEVTRDEWEDSNDANYHSGPNSLWNSLGMLFRDGLTNLLAVLTSGIAIYDGQGNNASNILAEFTANKVRVGGTVPENDAAGASVVFFDSTDEKGSLINATAYNYGSASDQDIESSVSVTSRNNDDGQTIDTGSAGESSLTLEQRLWYGITDVNESHNESESTLNATVSYNDGGTQAAARVAAIATTTDAASLSYVELTADSLGLGPDSGNVTYNTMDAVLGAIPVTLYDNASASASSSATLVETAANFSRLTIFFKDTDANFSSVEVWNPDGKRVALSLTWINGASTQQMYQRVRWVTISGTSISTVKLGSDSKYRTGQIQLGATASVTNADYISIVHVIGYR